MPMLDYPVSNMQASSCDLSAGPTPRSEVTTALTQWYLQVDAGLIASHVWRLKFLNEDDNNADEQHKVHLRSKGKAEGSGSGQRRSMHLPLHRLGLPQQPSRPRPHPVTIPSRLIAQDGDMRALVCLPSSPQYH